MGNWNSGGAANLIRCRPGWPGVLLVERGDFNCAIFTSVCAYSNGPYAYAPRRLLERASPPRTSRASGGFSPRPGPRAPRAMALAEGAFQPTARLTRRAAMAMAVRIHVCMGMYIYRGLVRIYCRSPAARPGLRASGEAPRSSSIIVNCRVLKKI